MTKITTWLFTILTFAASAQTVEKLTVEPNHSTIGFSIPIAGGVTRVTGKFMTFDMKLNYVNQNMEQSDVNFTIRTVSVNTGIEDRDKHLQGEQFFSSEKHPEITFQSRQIRRKGKSYMATGNLQMRGVEKEVSIPFKVITIDKAINGVQIRWQLNRKDYGVGNDFKHSLVENFLSDMVDVEIDISVRKDKRGQ